MTPEVTASVVMPVRNSEKYVALCLQSLLDQTVKDFEILMIEDPPYDRTKQIVEAFRDPRIKYSRNPKRLGRYKTRNISVQQAKGRYIFFTDDDCVLSKNWIEQGLKSFRDKKCIAVEGKTYYVSEKYVPTFSDHVVKNDQPGQFMTCNMAYDGAFIKRVGGFDEKYKVMGDRDLGLRAKRIGKIEFNPTMIVYHQEVKLKPREFIHEGQRIRARVLLYQKFREKIFFKWRIVYPQNLLAVLFPPLVFGSLLRNKYRSKEDLALFPYLYVMILYERLNLWDMCARERVFLI